MNIRKLRKINIGSRIFKIIWDKKSDGGSVCYKKKIITIGIKDGETHTLAVLIHELKEMIHEEQATTFQRVDNESYYFFYNHAHHNDLCGRLSELLCKFIK